jgi:hypothetical protein
MLLLLFSSLFHVLFRCLPVLSYISVLLVLIYFIDFAANWLFTTLGSCKVGLTVLVLVSVCFYFLNQHKCYIFMVCRLGYHKFRNFSCLVFDTWCFNCMYFRLGLCIFLCKGAVLSMFVLVVDFTSI